MRCNVCDGEHRVMDRCPEKPDFFDCWKAWFDGERSDPMVWLAVLGTCLFFSLLLLGVMIAAGS